MAEAQYLVSEASLWSCVETNTSGTPDPNFYWVKFSGDTIINNVEYKHILRSPDSLKSHWLTVGYMREDSIGRVYKIDNYFKDEVLSFDFSLQEGDSLHVWGDFYYYVDSTALKPFGLDASPRKHIYFKWTTWIEGVASVSGPLWGLEYEDYVGVYPELICYFEDGELVYHNEKFSSCFPKVTSASALASAPPSSGLRPVTVWFTSMPKGWIPAMPSFKSSILLGGWWRTLS